MGSGGECLFEFDWEDRGGGGRLFEAGRLLTFSAFRMGSYSRWALIRGSELIRINTLFKPHVCNFFFSWDLAAVRIIGVSVIARCPQGKSIFIKFFDLFIFLQ